MDTFCILGLLAIGSVCIQLSNGATTSSPSVTGSTPAGDIDVITEVSNNVTSCPRFDNRQENETLYVPYIEGRCEMVVTVETVTLPALMKVKVFRRKDRVIRRPLVTFRPVNVEQNGEPVSCESLPNRSLGPFVFVDTVIGECQMLLKIQKQKTTKGNNKANEQGKRSGKEARKANRKANKGKRPGKRPRNSRFTFAPAYEYLDEFVY